MGAAAAPLVAVASVASTAFSVMGNLQQGRSQSAGAKMQAAKAEQAASFARIQADQTDGQMREELRGTLANIAAIRASANMDPDSPTGRAILDEERRVGDRERNVRVGNIRQQAATYDSDASFYRSAAKSYMQSSYMSAGASLFGGLARAASSFSPPAGGGGGSF